MNSSMAGKLPKLNEYDFYFIHIPKNGGTTFERCFLSRHFGHYPIQVFPQEIWDKTIAIFRNPFTRLVSTYNYSRMNKSYWHSDDGSTPYGKNKLYDYCHSNSFGQFIQDVCADKFDDDIHLSSQYKFVVTPDNEIPTALMRFEHLDRDLSHFLGRNILLPKLNVSVSAGDVEYFTKELSDLVHKKYEIDFKIHDYLSAHENTHLLPPSFL